jgi:hypothetical protein
MIEEYGVGDGMKSDRGNRSTQKKKPAPVVTVQYN